MSQRCRFTDSSNGPSFKDTNQPANASLHCQRHARSRPPAAALVWGDGWGLVRCARRVWVTLLEKGVAFEGVVVNLLQGEQRHPAFLALNPQGKVPALTVRGTAPPPRARRRRLFRRYCFQLTANSL